MGHSDDMRIIHWLCGKVRFLEKEVNRLEDIARDHEQAICCIDKFSVNLATTGTFDTPETPAPLASNGAGEVRIPALAEMIELELDQLIHAPTALDTGATAPKCVFCMDTGMVGFGTCPWCNVVMDDIGAAHECPMLDRDGAAHEYPLLSRVGAAHECLFCYDTGMYGFSQCPWCMQVEPREGRQPEVACPTKAGNKASMEGPTPDIDGAAHECSMLDREGAAHEYPLLGIQGAAHKCLFCHDTGMYGFSPCSWCTRAEPKEGRQPEVACPREVGNQAPKEGPVLGIDGAAHECPSLDRAGAAHESAHEYPLLGIDGGAHKCLFCRDTGMYGFSRCSWCMRAESKESRNPEVARPRKAGHHESHKDPTLDRAGAAHQCPFCMDTRICGFSRCVWRKNIEDRPHSSISLLDPHLPTSNTQKVAKLVQRCRSKSV